MLVSQCWKQITCMQSPLVEQWCWYRPNTTWRSTRRCYVCGNCSMIWYHPNMTWRSTRRDYVCGNCSMALRIPPSCVPMERQQDTYWSSLAATGVNGTFREGRGSIYCWESPTRNTLLRVSNNRTAKHDQIIYPKTTEVYITNLIKL